MSKPTTIKDAFKRWEEENQAVIVEAKDVQLQFQWPPIEKMDATLSTLVECEKLSLSTNMIDKIVGLNQNLSNLKILSLGRNNIKSLNGLEALGESLEELWISYNFIDKVRGLENMKKLRVLCIGFNMFRDWNEFSKFSVLKSCLQEMFFVGNPCAESMEENAYRNEVSKRLPFLKLLDGQPTDTFEVADKSEEPDKKEPENQEPEIKQPETQE